MFRLETYEMSLGINNRNDSLDLSKLEAMAWLVAFLGRAGSEKKRNMKHWDRSDKTADGTNPRELQRAKFFLSQRGVQAILKLRSLVLRKKPLWDDVQWDPHCGTRKLQTQTTFIVAERTMFPSAVQSAEHNYEVSALARYENHISIFYSINSFLGTN